MYLAMQFHNGVHHYQIRRSHFEPGADRHIHQLVFHLGPNPDDHYQLLDDEIPCFSDPLLKKLRDHDCQNPDATLERLLRPFFPRATRQRLDRFARSPQPRLSPLSPQEKEEIAATIHIFDRRRLYYHYYGGLDQSRLYRMNDKLCRKLLGCCRDEREYRLMAMESTLNLREFHQYIYTIFNLQRHFEGSCTAWMAEGRLYDEVCRRLEEEVCTLSCDNCFAWDGEGDGSLYPHLRRYLVMFFDYTPAGQRAPMHDFVRDFMNSHRTFRWPERKPKMSEERIRQFFSASFAELRKMEKKELTRLFRKKAKLFHPDQGGDHDTFVELMSLYNLLIQGKS